MKHSIKGALLSALVYPGSGQLILGRIFTGVTLVILTTIGLGVLIYRIARRLYRILDQVLPMLAEDDLDFSIIIDSMDQSRYSSWNVELISFVFVVICWICAAVHAYVVGKRIENQEG
jgi:TM2 domain-containing membrane protein YozV